MTIVGGGSLIVDDAERIVVGTAGGVTVCEAVDTIVDVIRGPFDCFLDEIRVEVVRFVPKLVVDGVFSFAFAGDAVVVGIVPGPLCSSVRTVLELVVSGAELTLPGVGHLKSYVDRSGDLQNGVYYFRVGPAPVGSLAAVKGLKNTGARQPRLRRRNREATVATVHRNATHRERLRASVNHSFGTDRIRLGAQMFVHSVSVQEQICWLFRTRGSQY